VVFGAIEGPPSWSLNYLDWQAISSAVRYKDFHREKQGFVWNMNLRLVAGFACRSNADVFEGFQIIEQVLISWHNNHWIVVGLLVNGVGKLHYTMFMIPQSTH